jgi:hypothetical protein
MLVVALSLLSVAASPTQLQLAAPGLVAVGVEAQKATFLNELLADELTRAGLGRLVVVTPAQVSALLGLERQKQLLGCGEGSCATELADALGSTGLVLGQVARLGDRYSATVQLLDAHDGRRLASVSGEQLAQGELPAFLRRVAAELVEALLPPAQNLLRFTTAGVEYDRRLAGSLWAGVQVLGFSVLFNFSASQVFHASALALLRYHPLDDGTKLAWGLFAGAGALLQYSGLVTHAHAVVGAELGYRWLRLSAALAFTTGTDLVGRTIVNVGLVPALTFALPF